MEFLLFWLGCGFLCAVVAANKGRSGCGWFICGIFLGPFAFILSIVSGTNQAGLDKNAIKGGHMKKCPSCAEIVKTEAVKCRFCGTQLK